MLLMAGGFVDFDIELLPHDKLSHCRDTDDFLIGFAALEGVLEEACDQA